MKVEVIKNEEQKITYPCLMEATDSKGLVVFMRTKKKGVVVSVGNDLDYLLGEYREDWCRSAFKPFTGKLQLSNE